MSNASKMSVFHQPYSNYYIIFRKILPFHRVCHHSEQLWFQRKYFKPPNFSVSKPHKLFEKQILI